MVCSPAAGSHPERQTYGYLTDTEVWWKIDVSLSNKAIKINYKRYFLSEA